MKPRIIGYHASHEQFAPGELRDYARAAQNAGFQAIMSSDHFAPWSLRQGQSGFVWAWLGAAMQATTLPFGSLAIPIGLRFHPALVAQAAATLACLYPRRLPWIALGTGEALNESVIGAGWPDKNERTARLREAADMIRALLAGETVTRRSGLIPAQEARLWSLPATPPALYGAALTPQTARDMGAWADGLITVRQSHDRTRAVVDAFRAGGGAGKPVVLQFQLSWAPDMDQARLNAWDQWRVCALDAAQKADLRTPADFDRASQHVRPEDMDDLLCLSDNAQLCIEDINRYAALGFEEIYVHNAGRNQREFITFFGEKVLPALTSA